MPKKSKSKGKKNLSRSGRSEKLRLKTPNVEEYGVIQKVLGDYRFEVLCQDGTTRLGHVRGSIQRKTRLRRDEVVLVELRSYQDGKCDICHQYKTQEVRMLQKSGDLTLLSMDASNMSGETIGNDEDFEFQEEETTSKNSSAYDPYAGIDDFSDLDALIENNEEENSSEEEDEEEENKFQAFEEATILNIGDSELLHFYGIHSRKDYLQFMRLNHPDRRQDLTEVQKDRIGRISQAYTNIEN